MATIYHIRQALERNRGNSFYRDKSNRYNGTVCGAPATNMDAGWGERKRVGGWDHPERGRFEPCPVCVAETR